MANEMTKEAPAENTAVLELTKDVSDLVMLRINDMVGKHELVLPDNYNAGTALRSAILALQEVKDKEGRTVFEVCTKSSIVNSLLNMCIQGLQPSKRQCYFIVYGNQLQLFTSYFGKQCALRRAVPSVHKIMTDFIREGDEVHWSTNEYGERYVSRVVTDPLTNYGKPIKFGFCNIFDSMGNMLATTLMSWAEIQISWKQSKTYNTKEDSPHRKFPEEMARRTLINRACKNLLNTSADADPIIADAINQTTEAEFEKVETPKVIESKAKTIKEKYQIGTPDEVVVTDEPTIPTSENNDESDLIPDDIDWPSGDEYEDTQNG